MRRAAALVALVAAAPGLAAGPAPAQAVNPFVGTLGDFGQLSPAAVAPSGMVQLGPDTDQPNHAGYDFAATRLHGLSHTRAVGVGCGGAGGDLRVLLDFADAPAANGAIIDKSGEQARAGYYRVRYGDGLVAEATATRGAGIIRFTVPRAGAVRLRLDLRPAYSHRISARWDSIRADDLRATLVAGTVCSVGAYRLHTASTILHRGRPMTGAVTLDSSGVAGLTIAAAAGDTIEVRTGLSSVDSAAAAGVRRAELGDRAFDTVATDTLAGWDRELGRIAITAPAEQRALFYTSLFRVMQTPVAIADPDGRFRGSDGQLQQIAPGRQRYASWALWDNYRTQLPLIALIDPARAADIARSLTALYAAGKQRWATPTEPFLTVRTEHAGVALLDFHRKGITGFDATAALAGMLAESPTLARNTPDERIEAAYDDWAVAQLAADLGDTETATRFRAQALAYRADWLAAFDRLGADADVVKARGLYQGTLWQYRWAAVFDLPWLHTTLGPRLRPDLDRFFAENLFNMTNQPDIHVPWLLAWSGDRTATARIVHRYLADSVDHGYTNGGKRPTAWHGRSFALAPQGYADGMDDDAGAMSAWYVWGVLGLYPLVPGQPDYVVGQPTVCRAVIANDYGQAFVIEATSAALDAPILRGRALTGNRIAHSDILAGGTLAFPGSSSADCTGDGA